MILVIEDIDSIAERARSYFLNLLDGATSQEGMFLIGTTNYQHWSGTTSKRSK
nr:AAA family ATPase [Paenibacillus foliorum]